MKVFYAYIMRNRYSVPNRKILLDTENDTKHEKNI